jgi:aromatic ring-opening dioxygenase catalytic subunit (LigB family)
MKLINPSADVPIVQMSVLASQSPRDLFRLGQALQPLREQNIAIIGSGFASYHNLRDMFSGATSAPGFKGKHSQWARSLDDAMSITGMDERSAKLTDWRKWPHASAMHPPGGAEHFSPLRVCAGAAGEQAAESWTDEFMGFDNKSYFWK